MGKAFVCECGYIKTDHQTIKGVHKGNCDWFECECIKFMCKTIEMRSRTAPIIDSIVENHQYERKQQHRVLQIKDLKFDGTPRVRKGGKS